MSGYPVFWTRVTALTVFLVPVSWVYRLVITLRRALYASGLLRAVRLPVPVIVIGNISVGGTGKTPLVLWLVERLRSAGFAPGIVSRGYGAPDPQPRAVGAEDHPAQCGDEPVLLARRSGCPVWIGANRAAAARALLAAHPACNVIVSDDGLQHYALARDAEIAVIDGLRGPGNGLLLPAGALREPESRLQSVDAIVVRGGTPAQTEVPGVPRFAMSLVPGRFRNLRDPQRTVDARHFDGQRVHAAAGIGNPMHFFNTLAALGLRFTGHVFPDHHRYRQADLVFDNCEAIVMTEKDAVKCKNYATEKIWVLGVTAQVDHRLATMLIERLQRKP